MFEMNSESKKLRHLIKLINEKLLSKFIIEKLSLKTSQQNLSSKSFLKLLPLAFASFVVNGSQFL